jgi:hypothetical protein
MSISESDRGHDERVRKVAVAEHHVMRQAVEYGTITEDEEDETAQKYKPLIGKETLSPRV